MSSMSLLVHMISSPGMILPQKSGVVVKPLFSYPTIPSHIELEIYAH